VLREQAKKWERERPLEMKISLSVAGNNSQVLHREAERGWPGATRALGGILSFLSALLPADKEAIIDVAGHQAFHPFHFGHRSHFHFGNPLDQPRISDPLAGSLPFKLSGESRSPYVRMQCVVHDVVAHLGLAGIAVVSKGNRHKLEWPVRARFPFYYSARWLLWRVDIHLLSPSPTHSPLFTSTIIKIKSLVITK